MNAKADRNKEETRIKKETNCFSVDSFASGISFGQHGKVPGESDLRDLFRLKTDGTMGVAPLRSRYCLKGKNLSHELDSRLFHLSQSGHLGDAVIFFGLSSDPFHPFDKKFDASMRFLETFKHYSPRLLVVQTRSPLLVIALPVLRKLRERLIVTIPVETNSTESINRYTPFFPKLEERIRAITALRRFGITVNIQVGPLLPYGDIKEDATSFARFLVQHGDYIHVTEARSHLTEKDEIAKALAEDGRWDYLRKGCSGALLKELEHIAPEKLRTPQKLTFQSRQLSLFAA